MKQYQLLILFVGFGWYNLKAQTNYDKRTPILNIPYTISQSGSYYLTSNLTNTTGGADGITISTNDVTIDLNGFSLLGGNVSSDEGIFVSADYDNIIIKNGTISGWDGDGIRAMAADQTIIKNVLVTNCGGVGILVDFNSLIINCQTKSNGTDGIETDDGSIVYGTTASYNQSNGIQVSTGTIVLNSSAFYNGSDGIDIGAGGHVENSTASENTIHGIDLYTSTKIMTNTTYRNGRNGIDINNASLIMNNVANANGTCISDGTCTVSGTTTSYGVGIKVSTNSFIINNTASANYFGIAVASSDAAVLNCHLTNNKHTGLLSSSSGSFFINNTAHNNGISPIGSSTHPAGDMSLPTGNAYGPIVDVSAAGNILGTTNADFSWANFKY